MNNALKKVHITQDFPHNYQKKYLKKSPVTDKYYDMLKRLHFNIKYNYNIKWEFKNTLHRISLRFLKYMYYYKVRQELLRTDMQAAALHLSPVLQVHRPHVPVEQAGGVGDRVLPRTEIINTMLGYAFTMKGLIGNKNSWGQFIHWNLAGLLN